MALLVQKFGGSSVGSLEKIRHVADRVASRAAQGHKLVVVVSAMQGETDRLLGMAHELTPSPDPRETDQLVATGEQVSAALLAIALKSRGLGARSLTGSQMRMLTDGAFTKARIKSVDRRVVDEALDAGEVVVATGFQGIDSQGNVTTLGRGGSDTSAVALAAGLRADECEIYTDVTGVFTADPRICPKAVKLPEIAFDEMMEMASQGSKVLQIRSVELAMNHNIPVRVRSTFSDDPGTLVRSEDGDLERMVVRGISHNDTEVKITLRQVPDRPGIAASIFTALAQAGINVDVIVQNTSKEGTTDLSFTCGRADQRLAENIIGEVAPKIGADAVEVDPSIAKVSIVGVGMRSHPGVAAAMFEALHAANVNIQMITTSEIKVTCVIDEQHTQAAVQTLHDAFDLHLGGKVLPAEDADDATGDVDERTFADPAGPDDIEATQRASAAVHEPAESPRSWRDSPGSGPPRARRPSENRDEPASDRPRTLTWRRQREDEPRGGGARGDRARRDGPRGEGARRDGPRGDGARRDGPRGGPRGSAPRGGARDGDARGAGPRSRPWDRQDDRGSGPRGGGRSDVWGRPESSSDGPRKPPGKSGPKRGGAVVRKKGPGGGKGPKRR